MPTIHLSLSIPPVLPPIRVDTTRVEFTISLRENWSLPFLALQVTAITCYLRPQLTALQQVHTNLRYSRAIGNPHHIDRPAFCSSNPPAQYPAIFKRASIIYIC